jgi:hypothetical protein
MLNWIKGSDSDHPLADDKAARELIAELPADPYKSLEELRYWLESLQQADDLKLGRVYEIVDLIDQSARGHLRKLSLDYVTGGSRLQRFHENRIWTTVTGLWGSLGAAYRMLLRKYQAGANGWNAIKPRVPQVVLRAIRCNGARLKWYLLRYGPIDRTLWADLGRLLAYGEEQALTGQRFEIYPGHETTIERETLKVLMLAVSSTDSLLPAKLDLAERLIARFADQFALQKQPAKGCHFCYDLGADNPPGRFVERVRGASAMRFFGPGNASQGLAALAAAVRNDGALPANLDAGPQPEPATVTEVLDHLVRYWSPQPPARSEERRRSVSRISVVHGFADIVGTIAGDSRDLSFYSGTEAWTVENESEGGYGAVLPQAKADWLKVGTLLGVRLADGAAWGVGIVRRLTGRQNNEMYVGIQLLARGATAVKLSAPGTGQRQQDALLLPSSAAESASGDEMSVLMRAGSFTTRGSLDMKAYELTYLLMPQRLLEGGTDFDMARFRVLKRAV